MLYALLTTPGEKQQGVVDLLPNGIPPATIAMFYVLAGAHPRLRAMVQEHVQAHPVDESVPLLGNLNDALNHDAVALARLPAEIRGSVEEVLSAAARSS